MSSLDDFKQRGYLHVKGLLSEQEVIHYKKLLQNVSGLTDKDFNRKKASSGYSLADGIVKKKEFWPLIYQERLIQILNDILEGPACFTQHTDLHVHHGAVGWHRDNAYRKFNKGPDWDETQSKYSVLRVGIYLHSFETSQFRMGVIPNSHKSESFFNALELKGCTIYSRLFKKLPPIYFSLKPTWLTIEAGDCLIFDQRVLHTGTETLGPKYAMYLGYSLDNEHSKNHMNYFYSRKDLSYESLPNELASLLQEKSLLPSFLLEKK